MSLLKHFTLLLPLLLLLAACDSSSPDEEPTQEGLAPEQVAEIDAMPSTDFDLDSMVLPNGWSAAAYLEYWGYSTNLQARPASGLALSERGAVDAGPQAQKNLVIALMSQSGLFLADRDMHTFDGLPPQDGVERPAQNGIGYVWGGKDYTTRSMPPDADIAGNPFDPPSCREHLIHGVDASGFVVEMASAAGFTLNPSIHDAHAQSNPDTWNELLLANGLDKIRYEALSITNPTDLEPGDIIYWNNSDGVAHHIGFVGMDAEGNTTIIQSYGSRSHACEENFGELRGPRQIDGSDSAWFNGRMGSWHVNRLVTDLSGMWGLYLRCAGETTIAFEFEFEISTTDQESNVVIQGSGAGMDYTGVPMHIVVSGVYQPPINTLSAQLHFTWEGMDPDDYYRIDGFERRLDEDDTGFFVIERIEQQPSPGCVGEARLVNLETAEPPVPAHPGVMSPSTDEAGRTIRFGS